MGMYSFIRYIVFMLLIAAAALIYGRIRGRCTGRKRKVIAIVTIVITFALCLVLWMTPVENAFMRFPTSQKAFAYSFGNKSGAYIMEHEDCAVVWFGEGFVYFYKDQRGWEVTNPNLIGFGKKFSLSTSQYSLSIHDLQDSDYSFIYVGESPYPDRNLRSVSDSKNSVFTRINAATNLELDAYYAFVDTSDPDYRLIINGEEIAIQ